MTQRKTTKGHKGSEVVTAVRSVSGVVPAEFCQAVADILRNARSNSYRAVNFIMVEAYWNVGRMIVEEEQHGEERAGYGKALIRDLSDRLTLEFGSGFGVSNLSYFRQFYLSFPIFHAPRGISAEGKQAIGGEQQATRYALRNELTWTHYRALIRVENLEAREWYMKEAADQNWSTRALDRQINSLFYERLLMSRDKAPVVNEMRENNWGPLYICAWGDTKLRRGQPLT